MGSRISVTEVEFIGFSPKAQILSRRFTPFLPEQASEDSSADQGDDGWDGENPSVVGLTIHCEDVL
jgi:hypothetical protein